MNPSTMPHRRTTPPPSPYSGVAITAALSMLAWISWKAIASPWVSGALLLAGFAFGIIYYAVPSWRHVLLDWFETVTFPVRWVATLLVLSVVYYLVLFPIAIWYRASGRSMRRRSADATSNWQRHDLPGEPDSYFKTF